jgi:hypothetical protein
MRITCRIFCGAVVKPVLFVLCLPVVSVLDVFWGWHKQISHSGLPEKVPIGCTWEKQTMSMWEITGSQLDEQA